MKKLALTIAASVFSLCSASAEDLAIVHGTLHTATETGTIEDGTILISDGKITDIGTGLVIPKGYRVIDAKSNPVTPGLMGTGTNLGLVEVPLSASMNDATTSEKLPFSAALDVSYAYNPDTTMRNVTRIEGVTRLAIMPSINKTVFGGLGALVQLGDTDTPMSKPRAFMFVDLGRHGGEKTGGSRAAAWVQFEAAISDASKEEPKEGEKSKKGGGKSGLKKIDLEAIKPVIGGDIPLLIRASRTADIRQIIAFKERNPKIRIVILDGAEAWRIADELAAAEIPVIVHPLNNLPGNFESLASTLKNAAKLNEAGVKLVLTTFGGRERHYNVRLLPQLAGNAILNGLPWETALQAVTSAPAEIFGWSGEYGDLTVGKTADIVIWNGDPFEIMSSPAHVIIEGNEIELTSRQTKLRDRYLDLARGELPPAYKH